MTAKSDELRSLALMIRGFQISQMIRLVVELGIADRVAPDACEPVSTLAVSCGAQADPLLRVLRALAAFGVFSAECDGKIGHSPKSLLLRRDARPGLFHSALFFPAACDWAAWGALDCAVRDGAVPFEAVWGTDRFGYLHAHPDHARLFDAVMAEAFDSRFDAVAAAYDFSGATTIADIGGGNGSMLRAILSRHPGPSGVLVDRPDVVGVVPPEACMEGRITVQAGDFLSVVRAGADIYLLSWILHDWDDSTCLRILRNCRRAMASGGRLLVIERLINSDPSLGDPLDYLTDLQMMVVLHGRERTLEEFTSLLHEGGFCIQQVIRTEATAWVIACDPID